MSYQPAHMTEGKWTFWKLPVPLRTFHQGPGASWSYTSWILAGAWLGTVLPIHSSMRDLRAAPPGKATSYPELEAKMMN